MQMESLPTIYATLSKYVARAMKTSIDQRCTGSYYTFTKKDVNGAVDV